MANEFFLFQNLNTYAIYHYDVLNVQTKITCCKPVSIEHQFETLISYISTIYNIPQPAIKIKREP